MLFFNYKKGKSLQMIVDSFTYLYKQEIRNHRRLAIISDFSLLAPLALLEPNDPLPAVAHNLLTQVTPFPRFARRVSAEKTIKYRFLKRCRPKCELPEPSKRRR